MKNLLLACQIFSLLACQLVSINLTCAEVSYHSREKTLSVKAEGQAFAELLNEIKERTGINVEIAEGINGNVYQEFYNLSLESGLKRLLKTKSYSFIYSGNSIKKINVFSSGTPSSTTTITTSASTIPSQVFSGNMPGRSEVTGGRASIPSAVSFDRQKLLEDRRMKVEKKRRQRDEMRR